MDKDELIKLIENINIIFPERLKDFREKSGLSLRETANLIGKSPSQVSFWERGINPPSSMDLFRLCLIYNISLADLFPGTRKEFEPCQHEIELLKKYRSADKEVRITILKILEYTSRIDKWSLILLLY